MGFLASQHGQLGAIPPPPFWACPPWRACEVDVRTLESAKTKRGRRAGDGKKSATTICNKRHDNLRHFAASWSRVPETAWQSMEAAPSSAASMCGTWPVERGPRQGYPTWTTRGSPSPRGHCTRKMGSHSPRVRSSHLKAQKKQSCRCGRVDHWNSSELPRPPTFKTGHSTMDARPGRRHWETHPAERTLANPSIGLPRQGGEPSDPSWLACCGQSFWATCF